MTFQQFLVSLGACSDALDWVGDRNAATALTECERADWILWLLPRLGFGEAAQRIGYLAADRAVRIHAPAKLDAAGLTERAARLRALKPIVDRDTAEDAAKVAAAWATGGWVAAEAAARGAAWATGAAWVAAKETAAEEHHTLVAAIWAEVSQTEVAAAIEARMGGQ